MSFLSELKSRRISAAQFVAKSGTWLLHQAVSGTGKLSSIAKPLLPSDAQVDQLEQRAEDAMQAAAQVAEDAFTQAIVARYPLIPAETARAVAGSIGNVAIHMVDSAISAFGGAIKANNVDAPPKLAE